VVVAHEDLLVPQDLSRRKNVAYDNDAMTEQQIPRDFRPKGWNEDPLSEFLDMALNNTFATYQQLQGYFRRISDVDRIFLRLLENLNDPEHLVSPLFLFRAHSSYRAAARLAFSGQVPESYSLTRACLENALYALFFAHEPAAFDIWLKRQEDEAARKKIRREFTVGRFLGLLEGKEPTLGKNARTMYERTIDYGAHPNPQAIFSSLSIEETETELSVDTNYLMGNTMPLHVALKTVATVGILTLEIAELVFPERFTKLGIRGPLEGVKQGL
jgi:hypothetical protein